MLPEPMAHRRAGEDEEGNWAWLANDDRREDILVPGWIVDAAHRTVQIAGGDLDRARWAANLAHDVDPYSDTPLLDLLVIAAAAGDMATAYRHAWEVLWGQRLQKCLRIYRVIPAW